MIKRLLDVGARSLLVPFVQNAEEARRAVAATRYPPLGIRGVSIAPRANLYGRVADYHRAAHERACVVEGVDGIFIGPSDLAADFGHLANPRHPEVQYRPRFADSCARIRAVGAAVGILTGDPDEAARYLELGFTFVAVGSDVGILARGSENLASRCEQLAAALVKPVLPAPVETSAGGRVRNLG